MQFDGPTSGGEDGEAVWVAGDFGLSSVVVGYVGGLDGDGSAVAYAEDVHESEQVARYPAVSAFDYVYQVAGLA